MFWEFDELRPYRILIKEMSIESIESWTNKKIISIVFDSNIKIGILGENFLSILLENLIYCL